MKLNKKNILVIDDEIEMLESLKKILSRKKDLSLQFENNPSSAINKIKDEKFDIVITDLKMTPISGIEIIKTTIEKNPSTKVIVISGYGTIEASVDAMRYGAYDFIEKPFTSQKLFDSIERALNDSGKIQKSHEEPEIDDSIPGFIYKSMVMNQVVKLIKKLSKSDMNILITGESGTGKEIVARAIHNLSKSSTDPFVPVNCGALPEHLFESELFGHERGAFTGAIRTKPGLLEFANHGTFFFDEIGELTPSLQVKLLRMLEERKIRRVGGEQEINIDVRIIAASNKDLKNAVENNEFREDLYYRLCGLQIDIPPLRERIEDIIPIAEYFLGELCEKADTAIKYFSIDAIEALKSYPWPGNVRELQNIIGKSFFLSSEQFINLDNLPIPLSHNRDRLDAEYLNPTYKVAKEKMFEKFEVDYLTHHLRKNKGNISQTAEKCGLDRRTIHRLINKYNIVYKED